MYRDDLEKNGYAVFRNKENIPDYHFHKNMELSYIISGKGTHIINGEKSVIKKGDYLWYSVTTLISITLNIGTY